MTETENKIEEMKSEELIDEIGHQTSMIKSNILRGYEQVEEKRERLKVLRKEALRRMKNYSSKT